MNRYHDGVTQKDKQDHIWLCGLIRVKRDSLGKSGESLTVRRKTEPLGLKLLSSCCQEKPLRRSMGNRTSNRHR